jgi:glycosyltransferase involved in cell wall biosynthesis
VISVRDFAIPELVRDGETGLLLDRPLTPDAIAKAIRSLLLNPARLQSMSEQAVRFAEQSFSWDAIGQRMVGAMAGRTGDGRN